MALVASASGEFLHHRRQRVQDVDEERTDAEAFAQVREFARLGPLPWTVPPLVTANLVRYHLLGRTGVGRGHLQRRGERAFRTLLRRYSGQDLPGIGELNV